MFVSAAYFHPNDCNGNDHVPEPAYKEGAAPRQSVWDANRKMFYGLRHKLQQGLQVQWLGTLWDKKHQNKTPKTNSGMQLQTK